MIVQLLLIAGSFLSADPGEYIHKTQPRDSIRTEFVLRSEDLLWQSGWNTISLDRMSFKTNTRLYGYYGPQPTYLIDGIPVDPSFFGMTFSQLLPISFNQIEGLDSKRGVGLYRGIGYHSGLLNIKSVPLTNGLSLRASGQVGHNSDEPGPWVFDPNRVTPNIERFGPWADAGLSLKFGSWYAKGVFRYHTYLNINPFVQTRMKNLMGFPDQGDWPEVNATTHLGMVETGVKNEWIDFRLQGIQSESEEFLFFQPLAREVPTGLGMNQYTAFGEFSFSDVFGIRTMAQYREKETEYRRNQLGQELDWEQVYQSARLSFFFNTGRLQFDIGSEYRMTDTRAGGISEEEHEYVDLFFRQEISITSFMRLGMYSVVTLKKSEPAYRYKGFLEFDIIKSWSTSFEGVYSELYPEVTNPVDVWMTQGYSVLNRFNIRAFIPSNINNSRLVSLSNRHHFQFSEAFDADLNVQFVNHLTFHVPFQDAFYNLYFSTSAGAYFLFTDNSGQRLMADLDMNFKWSEKLSQTLGIYWNRTLDGDTAYESYWDTVPEYLIQHSTTFKPYPDIELKLNVQYHSASRWDEFRRLDGELNRTFYVQFPFRLFTFSSEVPSNINADIIIAKWLWEQRLRGILMLNNLFDDELQTHPIGSKEGFGYMLRLELRF